MCFDEAKLLEIAGKGGLGDAQLLCSETAAQLFLVGDGRVRYDAEDLAVAERFAGIHSVVRICTHLYFYTEMDRKCQWVFAGFREDAVRTDMHGTQGQCDAGFAAGTAGTVDFPREVMLAIR